MDRTNRIDRMRLVKEKFLKLQKKYLAGLPATIDAIEKKLTGFYSAAPETKHLEALKIAVHRLRGTGGTFGLNALTENCEKMESICIKIIEKEGVNSQSYKEELFFYLKELRKIADSNIDREE